MIRVIDVPKTVTLEDYAAYSALTQAVLDLRRQAQSSGPLAGRTIWMVNSTAQGGGVAEMMPKLVNLLRELGLRVEWVVIGGEDERFFTLTKHIHNLLHGVGEPRLGAEERAFYEAVSRSHAEALGRVVRPGDLLVVHDPQPLGAGAILKQETGMAAVWRCHIGLDEAAPATRAAWTFLEPWVRQYDRTVFSIRDYVPPFLSDRAVIIPPAIDPLNDKNREMTPYELATTLADAALAETTHPLPPPTIHRPALRLQPDGSFAPATLPGDIGLLFRPIVTQVSRWDRLKGFGPLLEGFAALKRRRNGQPEGHRSRLDLVRLVLAGPDPTSIQDDPEGLACFEEVRRQWLGLPPDVQQDAAVLLLPMESRAENARMVNALQRCSTIVAQNSLREGFGLTVTEAMWKRCPVLGTHAAGIRHQIRDGEEGRLLLNPEDPDEIAATLDEMLAAGAQHEVWARNAQRRVATRFLIFSQVQRWIEVLSECC